jgi:hypothetical protein
MIKLVSKRSAKSTETPLSGGIKSLKKAKSRFHLKFLNWPSTCKLLIMIVKGCKKKVLNEASSGSILVCEHTKAHKKSNS